jgi:hypothetical protein
MSRFTNDPLAYCQNRHDNQHVHSEDLAQGNELPTRLSRKELRRAHSRILDHRARVSTGRLRLQRKRIDIRQLVERSSKLEDIILSALDHVPDQTLPEGEPPLSTVFEQVRGFRHEIRSLEHQYNEDDDDLACDEDALDKKERHFFETYETVLIPEGGIASSSTSRSTSRPSRRRSKQGPSSRTTNPLYDYETKIGQANILRERINELPLEREEYQQEKAHLDSQGLSMDPLDLEFLDDYEDILAKYLADLAAVEAEIHKLEQAAIESGMVHPSMTYFNPRSNLPDPLMFEPQSLKPQDGLSRDGLERMQIELPEAETPVVDQKLDETGGEGLSARSPGTRIYQWLKGVPVAKVGRAIIRPRNIASDANLWMQSFNWILGRSKKEPPSGTFPRKIDVPNETKLDQLGVGWVSVDPTVVRRRSTGELRPQLDDETTPHHDNILARPPPNASHDAPNFLQPSPDDCESRSSI